MKKFILILIVTAGFIMGQTKTGSTAAPFLRDPNFVSLELVVGLSKITARVI